MPEPPETLDELFEGSVGSVEAAARRKRAAATPHRLRVLYHLYRLPPKRGIHSRPVRQTRRGNLPEANLDPMLEANLIAKVPHPTDRAEDTIRLTALGEAEIAPVVDWLLEELDGGGEGEGVQAKLAHLENRAYDAYVSMGEVEADDDE